VFGVNDHFFWVPIAGPILGAITGAWIYKFYASIVRHYGQFFNTEHKDPAQTVRKVTPTDDDVSELREHLTVDANRI